MVECLSLSKKLSKRVRGSLTKWALCSAVLQKNDFIDKL